MLASQLLPFSPHDASIFSLWSNCFMAQSFLCVRVLSQHFSAQHFFFHLGINLFSSFFSPGLTLFFFSLGRGEEKEGETGGSVG